MHKYVIQPMNTVCNILFYMSYLGIWAAWSLANASKRENAHRIQSSISAVSSFPASYILRFWLFGSPELQLFSMRQPKALSYYFFSVSKFTRRVFNFPTGKKWGMQDSPKHTFPLFKITVLQLLATIIVLWCLTSLCV